MKKYILPLLLVTSLNTHADVRIIGDDIIGFVKEKIQNYKDKAPERQAKRAKRRAEREKRRLEQTTENKTSKPVPVTRTTQVRPTTTLESSMMPQNYKKRDKAELNAALVYYGDHYSLSDLARIQSLFEKRFFEATGNQLKINVTSKTIYPFKHDIANYPEYTQENVSDIERLQRLWYYDNVKMKVGKEIYDVVKETKEVDLADVDMILAVTGAQFDGLGFASGRVAVTENPMEIAWGTSNGGRVDIISDEKVVDELIHEAGHVIGLDHVSRQCMYEGIAYEDQLKCCAESENANDVLSYCRRRDKVDANFFYGFQSCTKSIIKEQIVPRILSGDKSSLVGIAQNCK